MKANELLVIDTRANKVLSKFNTMTKAQEFVIRASNHNPGIEFVVAEVRLCMRVNPKRNTEVNDVQHADD